MNRVQCIYLNRELSWLFHMILWSICVTKLSLVTVHCFLIIMFCATKRLWHGLREKDETANWEHQFTTQSILHASIFLVPLKTHSLFGYLLYFKKYSWILWLTIPGRRQLAITTSIYYISADNIHTFKGNVT